MEAQEATLRGQYEDAQVKANNLPVLKKELAQINDLLKTLVTRLPDKNEIPELVIDVSQAALSNGLQVDLFQQQNEIKHDFYAEKQIDMQFRGTYHQLGAFFSAIALQPRLVAVVPDGLKVALAKTGTTPATYKIGEDPQLSFTGRVRTYRYLSQDEEDQIAESKREAEAKNKKGKAKTAAAKPAAK
jgi:type IV pilus assembly protein PilO